MCHKINVRRFWSVMVTSPKHSSPQVILTVKDFKLAEALGQMTQRYHDRTRNQSLHIHFSEHPVVHVVAVDIPLTQLY